MAHIGERIRAARTLAGLSVKELAAELRVTAKAVNAWERGDSQPRPQRYSKIAKTTKARIEYIQMGMLPIADDQNVDLSRAKAEALYAKIATLSPAQMDLLAVLVDELKGDSP